MAVKGLSKQKNWNRKESVEDSACTAQGCASNGLKAFTHNAGWRKEMVSGTDIQLGDTQMQLF